MSASFTLAPPLPPPADEGVLSARVQAAEAEIRNVALARPNVLALLEAGIARVGEALSAGGAAALIGDSLSNEYVRCAGWPPDALPELVALTVDEWPALRTGRPVAVSGLAVQSTLGFDHALLIPISGAVEGAFVLGRTTPFAEAEQAAGGRLGALFSTLWAWSEAEDRFQRTVADLDDALFTLTYDTGVRAYVFMTSQVEAITGVDCDALLARDADWTTLVVDEDRAAFEAHDARLQAGEPSSVDVRLRLDDGDLVWVRERATPSFDAAGRLAAGGLLADVTAQKEAEAQLDRARRVAERAARTRMAFLRIMSHELRTPLGAIRGFAQLLQEEVGEMADAPAEVAEFSATIGDASARALRLVDGLLDLSRLETGALDLRREAVDVGALVRTHAARYAADLEAKGVDLRVETPADPVLALGDPARLDQVVEQLISNAAKFTPEGAVAVCLGAEDGQVCLTVEDTGVGISEDVLEALFSPFLQEDIRVNRDFEGTGLGLAIAHRLAEQMGGRLEAASARGEGSTFTLTLPEAG
ncbi:MAG: PAS domain-containing sensor histidine kinase [Bacteroidota bacterium]